MKLSVAICTYNGEFYLAEQLTSIAKQIIPINEIILYDDQSTDNTLQIAQRMQAQGLPIKIYQNPQRLGFIDNFSQAIQACTGDIIFLCDQDDIWKENKVSVTLNYFQNNPQTLLTFSDGELVDSIVQSLDCSLWQALPRYPKITPEFIDLLNNDWLTGAACAFRRELIQYALPLPKYWVHDAWLGIIASTFGNVIGIPEKLIYYRQHQKNQIGLKPPTLKIRVEKLICLATTLHKDKLEKYHILLNYVPTDSLQRSYIMGKIHHLENRLNNKKVIGIFKELFKGGYHKYANGWISFFRDVILLIVQTTHYILQPFGSR
jgi:glycosyltransferase involved in cell wall biosynthesis